jgi:hypothetical protein
VTPAIGAAYGALATMCAIAAVFFVRYWWLSKDRFFIWIASAFAVFTANWVVTVVDYGASEHTPYIFGIRLLGFLLIIAAVLFKNR